MLIIGDTEARDPSSSALSMRYGNVIAWLPQGPNRQIIVVGGPTQWSAPGPLPSEVVVTDLVRASLEEPALAEELWGGFLRYVACATTRAPGSSLFANSWGLRVRVSIAHQPTRAAVVKAFGNCRSAKLVVQEG